ncbi:hypothetical protein QTG54_014635 [Skeletonema marinoi]|uniref:AP2/ERF domain-containing protein n=1 Tax=Skeletonema marinoi TaxID=267567 RepID=A0AAD8XW21_9STRA|nr:hypothetical protein QTG54_014635 [Skeletonema marinoi]
MNSQPEQQPTRLGRGPGDRKNDALAPSEEFKQNYVGVTHRKRRGKFQARIYKMNKEYNIGLFDLATDAAFAYDAAYRLFGLKLTQKKVSATTPFNNNDGKSDPFDSDEANFVFNWLTYPDEAMMEVESPERMNFTCPSNYRAKRSEELASRLLAQNGEALKEIGIISEADLVAKVRKEIISISKLAAAICPVQKMFGRRACDLMFDELPEVEVRSRKRSRKPSREYLIKHQYVQQQQQQQQKHQQQQSSNATSNIPLQQMLLQQQMYGQAMMGSRIGYGNMFGSLPMNTMGPPAAASHSLLGYSRERAAMPNDSVSSASSAVNHGIPLASGSSFDPQLLYLMMQHNMPHSNMLSINEQLRNGHRQADMPQANMPNNRPPQVDVPFINEQPRTMPPQPAYESKQSSNNQVLLLPTRKSPPSPETKK